MIGPVCDRIIAQDIHFSQIAMAPLFENASNTGRYLGSLRVGGIYRQQWNIVNAGKYRTPLLSVDAPLRAGFSDKDWFGLGLMIYQDQSGSVGLSNGGVYISTAYHYSLDGNRNHVISLGAQLGFAERRLKDGFSAEFLDEIENVGLVSLDRSLFSSNKHNYADLNMGLQLRSKVSEDIDIRGGVNIRHLNEPQYALIMDHPFSFSKMFIFHGRLEYLINNKISISPSIYHYMSNGASATLPAMEGRYMLDRNSQTYLIGSFGTRLKDAFIFSVGAEIGGITARLSYDQTTSALSNINGASAIELSGYYTFKLKRKPNIKPVIFCPRF